MAKRPITSSLLAGFASSTQLNTIVEAIKQAFDNTVSRDGSTPNSMEADLDLGSNDILNAGDVYTSRVYLNGIQLADAAYVPNWRGEWATGTSYVVNDTTRNDGNVYICLVDHTSSIFATDLTASKWELFASKGSAGAGSGDMLAANNLSDVSSAATSRSNLGLGTVATESTVPLTKGGTGGVSASEARTNLGLGGIATTELIDEDDMSSDTAAQAPTQQSVKAYVDNSIGSHVWEEISRTTVSSVSSVDITWSADTYKEIRLKLINLQPSAANTDIYLRVRRNTTWLSGSSDYAYISEGYVVGAGMTEYSTAAAQIVLNDLSYDPGEAVNEGLDSIIELLEPDLTIETPIHFKSGIREDSSGRLSTLRGEGWVYGTTSNKVTGIRILPSTGNLASGYIIAEGLTY